jgi:hypothetical protein
MRHIAALFAIASLAALTPPIAGASTRPARVAPLSVKHAGQYTAQRVCSTPRPDHASCDALRVVRKGSASRAATRARGVRALASDHLTAAAPSPKTGEIGYTPEELHIAYELPKTSEVLQTIALVDAYNDPTAEQDLRAYDQEFGLPECTTANGCFRQYNENGELGHPPFPATTEELEDALESPFRAERENGEEAEGWGLEISLDIESAHAICENCHIALFESSSTSFEDFETTERSASNAAKADTEISNSWGGAECQGSAAVCTPESGAFSKPEIPILASAGDDGFLNWQAPTGPRGESLRYANFPASLPHVIAVGGTRLTLAEGTGQYQQETPWNGRGASGGGCSVDFTAPPWQREFASQVGCGKQRAVADVSADADPFTGLAVRYSREECQTEYKGENEKGETTEESVEGWCQIGGTSLAAPLIAGVYALAGGSHGVAYAAATLYENLVAHPSSLHDVTTGSNALCNNGFSEVDLSNCTATEEAAQCEQRFICLARAGYDGPTGVGTPRNITAFIPGAGSELAVPTAPGGITLQSVPVLPTVARATPLLLWHFALSAKAMSAVAHHRAKLSSIAFSFLLSRNAPIKVVFSKRVRAHHKTHWQSVAGTFTVDAVGGRDSEHLRGSRRLTRGLYQLSVLPTGGTASSIEFSVH